MSQLIKRIHDFNLNVNARMIIAFAKREYKMTPAYMYTCDDYVLIALIVIYKLK